MGAVLVGVAGGSGSGKSTFVARLVDAIGSDRVLVLRHDTYYRDRSHLPAAARAAINYDHPDALETELLVEHLEALDEGRAVDLPVYDFTAHTRRPDTVRGEPRPVVVVDGMLVLDDPRIRGVLDVAVFVDADPEIRLMRRLRRDTRERGRSLESVLRQYLETVRPMHLERVEPSRRYADVIVRGDHGEADLERVVSLIRLAGRPDLSPRSTSDA